MSVLKHRPKIELLAPPEVLSGGDLQAVVRLRVRRVVDVSGLTAQLVGQEESRFGTGEFAARANYRSSRRPVTIHGASRLKPGLHEHTLRMTVPSGFAPSYYGQRCSTRYFLKLNLGIPWWMDRRASFEIAIGLGQPLGSYPGDAALFASRQGGPEAKKGYLEGSVAADVLAPGDVLRGAVALHNTAYNRYARVIVSIIGTEVMHDKRQREEREVRRLSVEIDTHSPAEGESYALALRVPSNLAPSATARLWTLRWELEIVARVRLGRDVKVRLPVTIVPARFHERGGGSRRPTPSVGSVRLRALWQSVAKELGLEYLGTHMRSHLDGVTIEISRQHRGRRGWTLNAELRYESLRMDARVEEASLLRGTSFGGIKIGVGKWDKNHWASARCREQAEVFFRRLGPSLARFSSVALGDASAQVEVRDSGIRRGRLLEFTRAVLSLASDLAAVRHEIPVPEGFKDTAEAWQGFADKLDGALEHGDMSIRGRFQGLNVETATEWSDDGELWGSSIRLSGLSRIDESSCYQVRPGEGGVICSADLEGLPDAERKLLEQVTLGARLFACQQDELRLAFGPVFEPAAFEKCLPVLATLARTRLESVGPYR